MESIHVDVFAALTVAIVATALHTLIQIAVARASNEVPEKAQFELRIKAITAQISKLSPVSDFVEVSKLERQRVKVEKQLEQMQAAAQAGKASSIDWSTLLTSRVRPIAYVALTIALWRTPIAVMPLGGWGRPLAFPGWPLGTVSAIAWIYLCDSLLGAAVTGAGRATGLVPPPPVEQGGVMGMVNKAMGLMGAMRAK